MLIHKAYKTKLDPTRNQAQYLEQCGRVSRTVFNWLLSQYNAEYVAWYKAREAAMFAGVTLPENEDKQAAWKQFYADCAAAGLDMPPFPQPSGRNIRKKQLNAIKATDDKLRFMTAYPYAILQEAADDFDKAVKNYFDKRKAGLVAKKKEERKDSVKWKNKVGRLLGRGYVGQQLDPFYPNYKSRHDDASFRLVGSITVESKRIKLPKIGWIRLAESDYIPTNPAKLCYASLSQDRDQWYVSVTVEEEVKQPELNPVTVGVSVGVMDLVATSTGDVHENPRILAEYQTKKQKLQRELSRRTHKNEDGKVDRTAKNWRKTKKRLGRLEQKIERTRSHFQHVASKAVAGTMPDTLILKGMDIQSMLKDNPAAKFMSDAGMGEVTRRITYKAEWNGTEVIETKQAVADHCSQCGSYAITVNYQSKIMTCGACEHTMRATLNIAMNLAKVEHANDISEG